MTNIYANQTASFELSNRLANNKWTYLVANAISFSDKLSSAIKLNRPDDETLYIWLEKIAMAGQCSVLFVENLNMNDLRTQRLKILCENMQVTLINLTLDTTMPNTMIEGPWS